MSDPSSKSAQPSRKSSPSQFYRRRHPELFSDSRKATETTLNREVLSHHLETLTAQKLESAFEVFAARLVEKFIAPNLRPQTGPVGGGDGKTDAETYPVSEAVSQRWFLAEVNAGGERWAFAFSAKKDWRTKLRSDVLNIVGTERAYHRIYFITNQLVSAKNSAKEQDELTKKHGIPITILDRTWLLECVFQRDSISIATKTLGVGETKISNEVGPRDLARLAQLDKLESSIRDGSNYKGVAPTLVEDALRIAELMRGLERPRHEIEAAYFRAIRLAQAHSLRAHELRAVYGLAWTSYFWFDDTSALNKLYDEVERLALASNISDDLEKLANLLSLIVGAVASGDLKADLGAIPKRRTALLDALQVLRDDRSRPSNALQAHSLALTVQIAQVMTSRDQAALVHIWQEFIGLFEQAKGLGTFPFQPLAETLTQIGEFVPESEAFDKLYEALTDAMAARKSEGEAASKNCERGFQKLKKNLPYDAIRWFGRAVGLLIKEEYREELVKALIGSSIAYSRTGLFWAARNYALAAVAGEVSEYQRTKNPQRISPAVFSLLFDCELALGRVPFILSAYELGAMVRNGRARTDEQREAAEARRTAQGQHFGGLLLSTKFDDLGRIAKLPDALGRLGLQQAQACLLFLMGHDDILRADGFIPEDATSDNIESLFGQWGALARRAGIADPDYMLDEVTALKSRLLGCEIVVTCGKSLTSIGVGEALLGALEALLATSLKQRVMAHSERLKIRLSAIEDAPKIPALRIVEEGGEDVILVTHPPRIHHSSREDVQSWFVWLQESVVRIFANFVIPAEPEEWAQKILGNESGLSRAITFSNVPGVYSLIFGSDQSLTIHRWIEEGDVVYDLKRMEPRRLQVSAIDDADDQSDRSKLIDEPMQGGFIDEENLRHSDFRVNSPIDKKRWDAANWHAVFFMTQPGSAMPPVLGLTFKNRDAAASIFKGWRDRFGEHDPDNKLRIAILTGVKQSNPHAYAVIIGPNMAHFKGGPDRIVGLVSRINVMEPKNSNNLDMFLAEYKRAKRFGFVPAYLPDLKGQPEPMFDLVVGKYHLDVRPAWQVSDNDPDMAALDADDPPVIPADEANPPVLSALRRLAGNNAPESIEDPTGK